MLSRLKSAYRAISPIVLGTPLVLVDIGAARGLQPKWRRYRRQTLPVMFEPNPEEAARLRSEPDTIVVEKGLAAEAGTHTLNIAHWFGCSSMLDANPETLAGYKIADLYKTEQQVTVECKRYDELYREGKVPAPDAIKVDVEGYEYQVLSGFGDLLHSVLGIEAEAWFYPVFKGQKLLQDLVALLDSYDLRLRRLEKVPGFEGDMVCVNAFFTRGKARHADLKPEQQPKFDLLERVWRLDTI